MVLRKLKKVLGKLSLIIAVLSIILILNVFLKFIPFFNLGGIPLLIPVYVSPIGVILSAVSIIKNKNIPGICGLIINSILVIFQLVFIIIAPRMVLH
ncbi:asparagine N-glycosylation enzyme membrane subunit Stt3 [Clostridium acetobutylicum]|uniref:Predicted membrane, YNAG B.subtilis ortholog n=1 Tax=Clostridium acetobutylicum (strain ATCC 824 / DSM 792 / JCM 1419 / IAM 19013 / LMG 5710 / NBRC 13948 / NRRL B-527 / VKM B-1787 / 2291 / W) TaxID=272562 RepID=Q97G77_CLOAB|nr:MULTISPECIES: hypothetical protein [Clostridium]AAK80446.1 Predicted membrane, YNAG B.subtilis ortholog [Clostridium acetobutylicum ATCC 824]ADZ21543.1 membrane protein [Clostridium acetobutylicum EA 2018]AEI32384.1 hypothetical protein SMB_G2527 [Clostridium acetobutylicum DSM 1731]AWV79137.1 hypothetical protein DK921_03290 [Clostridium acetobutylicum]MBC2394900.1 hypothetical protein [Clostridium acetobutylicum]